MQTIKIFIASSEELTPERRVLADMQAMLNNRLFKQGVMLQLEFWEHLDSSMGVKYKQEEYNDVLKECDGCITLFWTRFGDFTKEEFELAFSGMSGGGNPKQLRVLFKNSKDKTLDLETFKDGFEAKYGDISATFNTDDQLRLALIEQVETILANRLEAPLHTISQDDKVVIGGAIMDNIKVLNIYIAMADDVEVEQNEFMDLVSHINKIFIRRNICLNIIKHKQNMGNLRECEICMTLYCTKFGDYTKEDLGSAYNNLKMGNNPRKLYVFFKNSNNVTPELQSLKDDFVKDFGHFFCKFENVDTMRLEFLLQLEAYQNSTSEKLLNVANQKIQIEGETVVDLNNVPFAAMNKEFCSLRDEIIELDDEIMELREDIADDPNNEKANARLAKREKKRKKLEEELNEHQEFLFDMARKTSLFSSQRISKRSAEAIRLFNEGDAIGANAVLNTEELERDSQRNFDDYDHHTALAEEARDRIEQTLKDWQLKINTALTDTNLAIDERISAALNAHEQVVAHAKKLKYYENNKGDYAVLLYDYALFAKKYARYDKSEELLLMCVALCEEVYGDSSVETANSYRTLAGLYYRKSNNNKAIEYHTKAIESYKKIFGENDRSIAICYHNLALCYSDKAYESDEPAIYTSKAKELLTKSLEILKTTDDEDCSFAKIIEDTLHHIVRDKEDERLNSYLEIIENSKEEDLNIASIYSKMVDIYLRKAFFDRDKELNSKLCLEYGKKAVNIYIKEMGEVYPLIAQLYMDIGVAYGWLEEYNKAREYIVKGWDIYTKFFDNSDRYLWIKWDTEIRYILLTQARKFSSSKKYNEALEVYSMILSYEEYFLNPSLYDLQSIYSSVANIYISIDDFDSALVCANKGLETDEKLYGERRFRYVKTVERLYQIGRIYYEKGNYTAALESLQKALTTVDTFYDKVKHSELASEISNQIGLLYSNNNDSQSALKYYAKALEKIELSSSANRSTRYAIYYNIGQEHYGLSNNIEALNYFLKALANIDDCADIEETLGVNASTVEDLYMLIADIYMTNDDNAKAIEYLMKIACSWEKKFGELHYDLSTIYSQIAQLYEKKGDYNEALENYLKAIAILEELLCVEQIDTAYIYLEIACVYDKLGDLKNVLIYAKKYISVKLALELADEYCASWCANVGYISSDTVESLEYHKRALEIRLNVLGEEHPDTAQSYFDVADMLIDLSDFKESLKYVNKSLAIRINLFGDMSGEVAACYNLIGYVYNEMGRYNEALAVYKKSCEIREELFGVDATETASIYHNLGKTYNLMGDYPQALEQLRRALLIRESKFGVENRDTIATQNLLDEVKAKIS